MRTVFVVVAVVVVVVSDGREREREREHLWLRLKFMRKFLKVIYSTIFASSCKSNPLCTISPMKAPITSLKDTCRCTLIAIYLPTTVRTPAE